MTHKSRTSNKRLHVLLIEDEPSDAEIEIAELRHGGFDVTADVVETGDQVRGRLGKNSYDDAVREALDERRQAKRAAR
jgi:hypothetical protein